MRLHTKLERGGNADDEAATRRRTAALIDAARRWLIGTPWDSETPTASAAAGETHRAPPVVRVLCQLMEVSRLQRLLADAAAPSHADAAPRHVDAGARSAAHGALADGGPLSCRLRHQLRHSHPSVQELHHAGGDAGATGAALGEDVADVFWALVLYLSAALTWRHRRHRGAHGHAEAYAADIVSSSRDTSQSRVNERRGAASRHESPRASLDSAATTAAAAPSHADSFVAALRSHYAPDAAVDARVPSRCQAVLQRVLPVLEARLAESQLWRQPSLLAALDVLARAVTETEGAVHAPRGRHARRSGGAGGAGAGQRCITCYAAALDDDLAVEALRQLRCYAAAYHTGSDPDEALDDADVHGDDRHARDARSAQETRRGSGVGAATSLSAAAVGWVAACRIALMNGCRSALARLCRPTPGTACAWREDDGDGRDAARGRVRVATSSGSSGGGASRAVLDALWGSWWQAELCLASVPALEGSAAVRGAAARWRSVELFLSVVLPRMVSECAAPSSARGSGGGNDGTATLRVRRALLAELLRLPLVTHLPTQERHGRGARGSAVGGDDTEAHADSRSPVYGTVGHWLAAHGDSPVLTLLGDAVSGYEESADDSAVASATAAAVAAVRPAHAHGALVLAAPSSAAGTRRVEESTAHSVSRPARPHVVDFGAAHTAKGAEGSAASADAGVASRGHSSAPAAAPPREPLTAAWLWGRHLVDTMGRTALSVACLGQHFSCVRLLLQGGASPDSLAGDVVSAASLASLPLPLLRLLYDPCLLEGTSGAGAAAVPQPGMAERLRQPTCPPAAAARTLARLALRLWTEKVQHAPMPRWQAAESSMTGWHEAYAPYRAAQDRVLRPAMAAVEFDPFEPIARLVLLAVLTRRLADWLTSTPLSARCGTADGLSRASPPSLTAAHVSRRQPRLQHTVALRLYTQLTCPLARALLCRAVAARCAVCAALEAREERALSMAQAAATAAARVHDAEADGGAGAVDHGTLPSSPSQPPLTPSEATKARVELQELHTRVLAGVAELDEQLAAEQHALLQWRTAAVEREVGADGAPPRGADARQCNAGRRRSPSRLRATTAAAAAVDGVATVLCGTGGPARYLLCVVPDPAPPRWEATSAGAGSAVVEPTLWVDAAAAECATPRQAWLRLPDGVDVDGLLREGGGGGAFAAVAEDMPLTAPLQRGDLVVVRHHGADGDDSGVDDAAGAGRRRRAVPKFVVERVFSDCRTRPYLLARPPRAAPPPMSVALPYVPLDASTWPSQRMTLHACCLPAVYAARLPPQEGCGTGHPLDWLAQPPPHPTSRLSSPPVADDVLALLQTSSAWASRWARTVWAGQQPCWLAEAGGDGADEAGAVHVTDPFQTGDGHTPGGEGAARHVLLRVRRAPAPDGVAAAGGGASGRGSGGRDTEATLWVGDVVVGSRTLLAPLCASSSCCP